VHVRCARGGGGGGAGPRGAPGGGGGGAPVAHVSEDVGLAAAART
jgi:hypothetical protein